MSLRKSLLQILLILTFALVPFLLSTSCVSSGHPRAHGDDQDIFVVTKVPIKKEQQIKASDVQRFVANIWENPDRVPWWQFANIDQFATKDLPADHALEDNDLFKPNVYLKTHKEVNVAAKDIPKGKVILDDDLLLEYRDGPNNYDRHRIVPFEATRNIKKGEDITDDMLGAEWREVWFAKRLIKKDEVLNPQLFDCKMVKKYNPEVTGLDTDPWIWKCTFAEKDISKGAPVLGEDVRYVQPKPEPQKQEYQQVVIPVASIKAGEVLKPEQFMLAKVDKLSTVKTDVTKIESLGATCPAEKEPTIACALSAGRGRVASIRKIS